MTRGGERRTSRHHGQAVILTTQFVRSRASRYRTLVVFVVLLISTSIVPAAIQQSWRWLLGLLLMAPLCATFFCIDSWAVVRWRRQILRSWADDGLDLHAFQEALTAVRTLPTYTIATMLAALPYSAAGHSAVTTSSRMRRSLASTMQGIDAREVYETSAVAGALAVLVVGLVAATMMQSWRPLLALSIAPLIVGSSRALATLTLRRSVPRRTELREAGLDPRAFVAAAAELNWRWVPAKERQRILTSLSEAVMDLRR